MTKDQFHNALRILRSIDLHELQAVGLWTDATCPPPEAGNDHPGFESWQKWLGFSGSPYVFFIRCDDETADKIWSVVEKRLAQSWMMGWHYERRRGAFCLGRDM